MYLPGINVLQSAGLNNRDVKKGIKNLFVPRYPVCVVQGADLDVINSICQAALATTFGPDIGLPWLIKAMINRPGPVMKLGSTLYKAIPVQLWDMVVYMVHLGRSLRERSQELMKGATLYDVEWDTRTEVEL